MPIATTEQYAAMLAGAAAGGHALAGVNVSSSEALNAALYGFTEAQADGDPPGLHRWGASSYRGPP